MTAKRQLLTMFSMLFFGAMMFGQNFAPIAPYWSLGHIIWEDSINTEKGAQRLYNEYKNHQIPVDGIIIDSPWSESYNDFNWDRKRYPHAEKMIKQFDKQGVKVILWLTGCVNTKCKDTPKQKAANYDEAKRLGLGVNNNTPSKWWKGEGLQIDFTDAKAKEWWYKQLDKVFINGVYGFKVDQGETYFGDTVTTSIGKMTNQKFRGYYYGAMSDYVRMRTDQGITIGRPYSHQGGFHSTPDKMIVGWCGDFSGDWKGLKLQIDNVYRSAQAGFGAVGCEVAGFFGAKSKHDEFIRYTQFGSMTASMINGGENGAFSAHLAWYHGQDATNIYRQCVTLHNQLRPYLFSVLVDAHLKGGSLLKNVSFAEESHMLGNDIFTKAITSPDGKATFRLPEGAEWVDYFSGECYPGGTQISQTYPLDRFPLFFRKGAIIPMEVDGTKTFMIYPQGTTSRKFYLPTGEGTDYQEIEVTYSEASKQLTVSKGEPSDYKLIMKPILTPESVDKSLSRHNFLYAGEGKQRRMYILENGQVTWKYNNPKGRGEISDAILMTDGNVLVAHQYAICEISKDGKSVWQYDAPKGTEIHTIQPIGKEYVLFVQNGHPAKVVVMKIPECQIVHEFEVPASKGVHGQFRNARLSTRGTLLLAHMGQNYVAEYSVEGNELTRWEMPAPWSVTELDKEHLLFVGRELVREIDRSNGLNKVVREIKTSNYGFKSPQKVVRLKNGNLILNNWYNEWSKLPMDTLNAPLQAIEIDKEGNVVWQLCSWKEPDLGPSTTIQPLDQAVKRERLFFGHFNGRRAKQMLGVNEPIGKGRGIHPGRVAWIHSPGVATWDGHTGLWVEDRWNNQAKADAMIQEAVVQLTGEKTAQKAWRALFRNFNKTHGKGNHDYKPGETIAIKLNLNNALTHRDTIELNSSPFITLALVRSMINEGGVNQQDIILCEPSRAITDSIYNKVHREFPEVRFIDNVGYDGREKCEYYPEQIVYSADNGKLARGLAKCIVDADYLINSALLKTHVGPGVTLTAKNWYGATDISLFWRNNAHNGFSQDKRHGKPGYKTFVDFMAHKHLGQKTLLFLIDGTYGSRHVNGKPAPKWQKAPFNNDWCNSIIVSQDEVACDAVAMDLIISEWPEYESLNYCDEYLREAATIPNPVSGTVYKQDGKVLKQPLGLMEHCDKDRNYKKLDLVYKKQ